MEVKLYRKPIPIYKFGDNLKESDSLERQAYSQDKCNLYVV